jgi:DNA mismatch endonuclease (patch repair protein)
MSKIRSKDTKPEMLVRKYLFSKGFRYRLHSNKLSGKPDLVLSKYKTVIFVHGCFWHGHGCRYSHIPKTRTEWWEEKVTKNQRKDNANLDKIRAEGWKVLTVWECELKGNLAEETLFELVNKLKESILLPTI